LLSIAVGKRQHGEREHFARPSVRHVYVGPAKAPRGGTPNTKAIDVSIDPLIQAGEVRQPVVWFADRAFPYRPEECRFLGVLGNHELIHETRDLGWCESYRFLKGRMRHGG